MPLRSMTDTTVYADSRRSGIDITQSLCHSYVRPRKVGIAWFFQRFREGTVDSAALRRARPMGNQPSCTPLR
jgi:hypothetical protein